MWLALFAQIAWLAQWQYVFRFPHPFNTWLALLAQITWFALYRHAFSFHHALIHVVSPVSPDGLVSSMILCLP
jgi:hypothetical protein